MPPPTSYGISHSITTLRLFPFAPYNRLSIYPCSTERVARSGGPFVSVRRTHYTARQAARMRVDASLSQRAREEWGVWRQASSGDRDSRFSRSLATRLGRLILLCMITFRHSRDKSNCVQGEKRPVLCFTSFSNLSNCSLINFR